jgi:hypothetical protein
MADDELSDSYIKRLQNLGPYKGKSPDEIRELVRLKRAAGLKPTTNKSEKAYDARFKDKFDALKQEFAVDLNDSNDVEALNNLVRLLIQSENVDRDIRSIQEMEGTKSKDDIMVLKNLGDFQRNLNMSVADVQEKLGITRKARKEKSVDDVPQWIDSVLQKSVEFFNRKTITVECPKCEIELIRYWLNFPDLVSIAEFSTECPHCGEIIRYAR